MAVRNEGSNYKTFFRNWSNIVYFLTVRLDDPLDGPIVTSQCNSYSDMSEACQKTVILCNSLGVISRLGENQRGVILYFQEDRIERFNWKELNVNNSSTVSLLYVNVIN